MPDGKSFDYLLSPGRIGSLELRNRIIMAPMGTNLGEPDGHMGERGQRFYEERARGGAGMIILGVVSVAYPAGSCNVNQVAISDDTYMPGLERLTRRIHAHGAKAAVQLQHAGKVARMDIPAGRPMLVPSAFEYDIGDLLSDLTDDELFAVTSEAFKEGAKIEFHPMTQDDIKQVTDCFADAADRARRAGFDGIEIHGGHGYLLSSFISPKTNKRADIYGGSIQGRARFLTDVIHAIRSRVGNDFPVWCRLDGKEFLTEGGITVDTAQQTAVLAAAAGVDAIHVSAYGNPAMGSAFLDAPLVQKPCGFVDLAWGIKKKVGVPVIAVGRIEPEQGDDIIKTGKADFIAMARKLIADPELPLKLTRGQSGHVRPCICCYTCVGEIFLNKPLACAANASAGKESEAVIRRAASPKQVLVIGGGPAGMETARIAALRGHTVTLCEKEKQLGGTLFFASMLYGDNAKLMDWLKAEIDNLPVDVRLGQEVSPELVKQLKPDVVVIAAGARREPPDIPGVDGFHVLGGDALRSLMTGSDNKIAAEKLTVIQRLLLSFAGITGISRNQTWVRELTKFWMPLGKRVAIIGGGLVGVEMAVFLAGRGRKVYVCEESAKLAVEMAVPRRWRALNELREAGVDVYIETRVESIGEKTVTCVLKDGKTQIIEIDTVIIAKGIQENLSLYNALKNLNVDVHVVGDCGGPGYIKGAMRDAAETAGKI